MNQRIYTAFCFVLFALSAITTFAADRPNVLFILVDDMGWRDLACYGHEIHETPNIDHLAARGMRFTNAYAACPICAPSRAAIMTGKFPSSTGFVDNYASQLSGKTLQRSRDRQFLKLDENIGRLLDWLDEKGLRKDTIIIFTSDNGGMVRATDNRPLRSYKGDLYEGGIRVPCIIDWPGVIRRGTVNDTPVHGVDFYATLLAMTGLPQQPEHHEDSVNLVPLLKAHNVTIPTAVPAKPSRPVRKRTAKKAEK